MEYELSEAVAALEDDFDEVQHLCSEIVATLRLNAKHFFRDDEPAKEVFLELLGRWEQRLKRIDGHGE